MVLAFREGAHKTEVGSWGLRQEGKASLGRQGLPHPKVCKIAAQNFIILDLSGGPGKEVFGVKWGGDSGEDMLGSFSSGCPGHAL